VSDATDGGSSRWKTFGERVIYDNQWVWLGQVDVELPDGERFRHHEAQGADQAITDAIDTHVQREQASRDDDDDGPAGVLVPAG
jgi:hypothetical protein